MIPSSELSKVSQLPSETWLHLQDDYWRCWQALAGSFRSSKKWSVPQCETEGASHVSQKQHKLELLSSGDGRKSRWGMFSLLFDELKRGWCFYSGHLREMEDKREHWAFSFPINGWKKMEGYSSLAEVEIHLVWIANCTHFPFSDSTELCCLLWLIMHKVLQISRKTAHLVPCLQPPIQNNTDFQLPAKKNHRCFPWPSAPSEGDRNNEEGKRRGEVYLPSVTSLRESLHGNAPALNFLLKLHLPHICKGTTKKGGANSCPGMMSQTWGRRQQWPLWHH